MNGRYLMKDVCFFCVLGGFWCFGVVCNFLIYSGVSGSVKYMLKIVNGGGVNVIFY